MQGGSGGCRVSGGGAGGCRGGLGGLQKFWRENRQKNQKNAPELVCRRFQ